ncbi:MAG: hypothetical protein FD169_347 [Bacillota bacterium]|nr:MAG: hypothetical protein FD169_347 [Bacillota bacterium]MBS3949754.1 GNAT family N-acetyltransferase [Peptococcaceae bacterium]
MHIDDGFTLIACCADIPIALISIIYRELPAPLSTTTEAFIDIIEVRPEFRRMGIARQLVERACKEAANTNSHQLRGWSSADKIEALPMWKELGFTMCPATIYPHGQEVKGYYFAKLL